MCFFNSRTEAVWHLCRLLRSSSAITASLLETILSSPLTYHTGLLVQLSSSQRPQNIWQCNRSKIFPVWFCSGLYNANSWCKGTGDLKGFQQWCSPHGFLLLSVQAAVLISSSHLEVSFLLKYILMPHIGFHAGRWMHAICPVIGHISQCFKIYQQDSSSHLLRLMQVTRLITLC